MLDSKETQYALQEMGKMFPNATTSLVADSDYHFLLAVILSAQTTDKAVNKVTPSLFDRYKYPIMLIQKKLLNMSRLSVFIKIKPNIW